MGGEPLHRFAVSLPTMWGEDGSAFCLLPITWGGGSQRSEETEGFCLRGYEA